MPADLFRVGFRLCARFDLIGTDFRVDILDHDICSKPFSIYAAVVGDEIVRIGSGKAALRKRLLSFRGYIGGRLRGNEKSSTPLWEALEWKRRLDEHGHGRFYAREGTEVTTPVGTFPAYLDEESILIGRFQPPLNRNKHR